MTAEHIAQYHHSRRGVGGKRQGSPVSEISESATGGRAQKTEGVLGAVLAERSDACRDEWWYWMRLNGHPEFWIYVRDNVFQFR